MSASDTFDGHAEEIANELGAPGAAVAPVPVPAQAPTLAVAPQASPKDLVARLDAIKETQKLAMEENVDYGVIPGTGSKPTLLKPGAEKLAALFQLDVQPQNEQRWEADDHLTVVSRVTIFHAPTAARLGSGEGICTTREKKYAKRQAQRKCPSCGEEAVIKGKAEYGGGWLCWTKKGGCNEKWADGAEEIEGQEAGEVDNPDLPDLWNTVDKMATKRALVAAVLIVTGASAVFTQDVEDIADAPANGQAQATQQTPPQATARERKPSERPISGEQKGKINALLAEAGLSDEEASAVRVWFCAKAECAHFDRLPSKQASMLIDQLGEEGAGARAILDDLKVEASKGHEAAQKILARMEGTGA